jgi:hypothetical protein
MNVQDNDITPATYNYYIYILSLRNWILAGVIFYENIVINNEQSRPELGIATADLDIRTFDLGAPFLPPPLPFLDVDRRLCMP